MIEGEKQLPQDIFLFPYVYPLYRFFPRPVDWQKEVDTVWVWSEYKSIANSNRLLGIY